MVRMSLPLEKCKMSVLLVEERLTSHGMKIGQVLQQLSGVNEVRT